MGKFLKRGPEKCSICGIEKDNFKHIQKGPTVMRYCNECYDMYYSRIEPKVKAQIMDAITHGKQLGLKEIIDITKKITKEMEDEMKLKAEAVKNEKDTQSTS